MAALAIGKGMSGRECGRDDVAAEGKVGIGRANLGERLATVHVGKPAGERRVSRGLLVFVFVCVCVLVLLVGLAGRYLWIGVGEVARTVCGRRVGPVVIRSQFDAWSHGLKALIRVHRSRRVLAIVGVGGVGGVVVMMISVQTAAVDVGGVLVVVTLVRDLRDLRDLRGRYLDLALELGSGGGLLPRRLLFLVSRRHYGDLAARPGLSLDECSLFWCSAVSVVAAC